MERAGEQLAQGGTGRARGAQPRGQGGAYTPRGRSGRVRHGGARLGGGKRQRGECGDIAQSSDVLEWPRPSIKTDVDRLTRPPPPRQSSGSRPVDMGTRGTRVPLATCSVTFPISTHRSGSTPHVNMGDGSSRNTTS